MGIDDRCVDDPCIPVYDSGGISNNTGKRGTNTKENRRMKKKWVLAMTLIFALLTGCGEGVEGRGDGQGIETAPPDTAPAVSEETPVV